MRTSDWSADVCSSDLSACPSVAIPDYTGDITLFNPPQSREASAIDVVANITNLRSTCDDSGPQLYTNATFDVLARRSDANGARDVTLPYFATVVRGGTAVVSKRVGQVNIHFADGDYRASASGTAQSSVDRGDRKSTRLNSSHKCASRMPSSA